MILAILEAGHPHFCEIILKLGHWPRRICCLKGFYLFIFLFCGHFVQHSGIILAILVGGHVRNISVKLF